jgi:hypothetical protein
LIHEIGTIDGGRGFQTGKNEFRIGGNTFYVQKNKIPMKIPESKRSKIGIIAEFRRIPNRFPNLAMNAANSIDPSFGWMSLSDMTNCCILSMTNFSMSSNIFAAFV